MADGPREGLHRPLIATEGLNIDGQGNQLVNWTTEKRMPGEPMNDWNKPGRLEDFLSTYEGWRFDWLDLPALIRESDFLFEYPMVDKDPVERWTF